MHSRVAEVVAIGRTPAQVPALVLRLRRHCAAHAHLDAATLRLAHPAEHHHEHVVRVRCRINLTADLGHPQLDSVVRGHWEHVAELLAAEGTRRFPDDDGLEPPRARGIRCSRWRLPPPRPQ
ncbi:MAG: hypothetical protein ACLQCU_15185 [Acidimicrobiales bacterium]